MTTEEYVGFKITNGLMLEWVQWENDTLKYVMNKSLKIS